MSELIEAIRAAIAQGATAEQKAIGAQACRTILTALDAEPGKPIVLPGAPKPHPLSGITVDQALDLAIARLTMVANAQDAATVPQVNTAPQANTPQPERQRPQIPPQPERQGPQIPLVRPSPAQGPTSERGAASGNRAADPPREYAAAPHSPGAAEAMRNPIMVVSCTHMSYVRLHGAGRIVDDPASYEAEGRTRTSCRARVPITLPVRGRCARRAPGSAP
jgi:hypothetical protein